MTVELDPVTLQIDPTGPMWSDAQRTRFQHRWGATRLDSYDGAPAVITTHHGFGVIHSSLDPRYPDAWVAGEGSALEPGTGPRDPRDVG